GTTSVNAVSGVATFSTLSINNAGNGYTLTASASGLTGATSASFNITAAPPPPATHVAFTTQPQTTQAGQTMPAVRVSALDDAGNGVTGFTGLITVAFGGNPGGGTLAGTPTGRSVDGVATFSTLSINNAGNGYTLLASASGLTGTTSASFNITAPPATNLAFTTQPQTTQAGQTMPAVRVAALDDAGNIVTGYTGLITVALGANPGGGTLAGTTSVNAVSGVATFSKLSINAAGNGYRLVESRVGLTGTTSASFNITTPPATNLAFTTQPQSTQAGQTMAAVRVTARDASGNTVTSYTGLITVAIGANPGGGTLSGTTIVNAVNGVATFSNLSINNPGNGYTLTASASGLTGTTSASFNITAPPATNLAFTTQPQSTQAGQTMPAVRVTARDASGNTVTGFTGLMKVPIGANAGGGTVSGATSMNAVSGVATFSTLSINNAGTGYTLTASASGLTGATSTSFNITAPPPPPATNLAFTTQPQSTQAGQTMPAVKVTARDASGNVVTGFTGTITVALGANPGGGTLAGTKSVAAVSGVATFSTLSINNAGTGYTLVASAAGLTGATSAAFNIPAPPNSAPVVNAGTDETAVTGLLYSTSFSFSDANHNGPWSYTINWGDGNTSTGTLVSEGSFSAGHTYIIVLPRSFTITVTVRDAAGASGSD